MKQEEIKVVTLKPTDGCWLTQVSLAKDEERIFSDSVTCKAEYVEDWIEWTNEQRTAYLESENREEEVESTEDNLERAKISKLAENEEWYNQVGYSLTYHGIPLKLDYETRNKLRVRLESEIAKGDSVTTIWYLGNKFLLPVTATLQLLVALEYYAGLAYDAYNLNIVDIKGLSSVEEVGEYDIASKYPKQLSF